MCYIDGKQQIVVVENNLKLINNITNSLKKLTNVVVSVFTDAESLKKSAEFENADVFIVNVDIDGFDGRQLYIQQRNRLRIVPFLFIVERDLTDTDWDYFKKFAFEKDIYDYVQYPYSEKKFIHKVNLMLSITMTYNMHTVATLDGLRSLWKDFVVRDRVFLDKLQQKYKKEK